MKKIFLRLLMVGTFAVTAALLYTYVFLTRLTPEQQMLKTALTQTVALLRPVDLETGASSPSVPGQGISTTLELVRSEGLAKELAGLKLDLAVSLPDKLRVSTTIQGEHIVAARSGQEVWAWQPSKPFALRAVAGVPLFVSDPARLDTSSMGPLNLPLDPRALGLLPALCEATLLADEVIEGVACKVLRARPGGAAVKLSPALAGCTLTLWLRPDGRPVQAAFQDGKKTDVLLALRQFKTDAVLPPETWVLPAPSDVPVKTVALRHVLRFLGGTLSLLEMPKLRPLGMATGERHVVAVAGKGRLEMHDGTRVLFLNGTPEEMGDQHGKLVGKDARHLVSRLLYGVGVGSSFAKGSWFFGTIEDCQKRIQPHVDSRYLREMDALAASAGMEKEEVRLANFFPELFHCSGFALTGSATQGGRIYHGRILDYMKGVGLEQNALVMVVQPDQGNAWVNIGYAGFLGSVTAMNAKHISVGEMGGRGEGSWDGKPMAQLVREVMEKASTLDEAVDIMRKGPRTCEYYYVIADGKSRKAVGIKATHDLFEVVELGQAHPQLDTPVQDTVLLSAGDRYRELVKRVQSGWGKFDDASARDLMTRPVCMTSNIQSVLFAPDTLDFWVAVADNENVASHARYTKYNLGSLLKPMEGE